MNVQIVLFDGFDFMDVIGPYEVFMAAKMYSQEVTVEFVSAEGKRHVTSGMNGPGLPSSGKIDLEREGILVIPGVFASVNDNGPNSFIALLKRAMETDLIHFLREALYRTDLIVSPVCGGTLILAMDGLLEGRHAVTHHMGMEFLGATGAIPVHARVVDDGNVVSGGGVTSGLDLALYLVERELGPRIAHAIEQLFEYEQRGTVWKAIGMAPIDSEDSHPESISVLNESVVPTPGKANIEKNRMFDGKWNTIISTPIGKLPVILNITTEDGRIYGTAQQEDEIVEFANPVLHNDQLEWSLSIRKPIRLNLKFSVIVTGSTMSGSAKAGLLPASKLVGNRM
ncbi:MULTISPECIES: DJ-1/PfpI family protein [Bacillus]|uniref:Thiamine biosynthesis protein ThiJ n=2 Tax=Bacillus TaxID=1386 RepID=A0A0M3R9V6_9BACI|nr:MULTISPECIES: DJ-1/PfpI family protein [Bacillus]ALC82102.1 thiamine biosynthesis protein ThiJ [Bacillus gobiensis]MBP1083455.1 putative intracellular protease/amidase [Bacillus capparidis]MED1097887.1 DJ-1/PfpI family protein [Bacillus capparidis]